MRPHVIQSIALAAVLTAGVHRAAADPTPEKQFWKDPEFVSEFIGSYGVNSNVEPPMSADEQLFYRELAAIISTNQTAAIQRLTTVLADGKTVVHPPAPLEPEDGKKHKKAKVPDPVEITLQNPASFWFTLGNLQVGEGQTDDAMSSYRRAVGLFPNFLRAHKNMGVLLVQNGKFTEAQVALTKALELGGNDGNLYGLMGACYLSNGENRSAELAYNQAMILMPGKKDWQLGAARALLYQGRYREAGALFGELIQKEPGVAQYWLFQANCYIGLNEPMKAAYDYEMVRELGAIDASTLSALGDIYLSRDLRDLALETYIAAFEKDPDGDLARAVKSAEVLAARRATEQSGKLIHVIREKMGEGLDSTQQVRLLRLESKLALAGGEDASAAKIMEDLINRDPMDGEIMLLLAGYYGRTGKVAEAESMYERAARLPDFQAEAEVRHAQLLVKQKSYDRAVKLLRSSLAIEPKDNVQRYLDGVLKVQAATRS